MNAVTCLTWIRRGVANAHPDVVRLQDEEMEKLMSSGGKVAEADGSSDEVGSDDEKPRKKRRGGSLANAKDSVETRYDLEDYDDEDDEDKNEVVGLSMTGLSFYASNQHDPYLSKDNQSTDDDSDYNISQDDNLIALCKVHGDFFSLEVWVTNVADGTLFCHHDVILPSCPLAIEWVGYDPGDRSTSAANLVAIGSMTPNIDLWDLDVVNTLEPAFTLKGGKKRKRKVGGSKKVQTARGHSDAVLALSWNTNRASILASASADESVGIWDMSRGRAVSFLTDHSDKVQAVHWHPVENQLLVSGSYDRTVRLFDCRSASASSTRHWDLGGEVEKVIWDHHNPYYMFAGTDAGSLACIDVRSSALVFTHEAHTASLSSLALSSSLPGCLVTASSDHSVRIWDVRGYPKLPSLVHQKMCKIGELHCLGASPDEPLAFCIGGNFEMKVLNLTKDSSITEKFGLSAIRAQENDIESGQYDSDNVSLSPDGFDADTDLEISDVEPESSSTNVKKPAKKRHSKKKRKKKSEKVKDA